MKRVCLVEDCSGRDRGRRSGRAVLALPRGSAAPRVGGWAPCALVYALLAAPAAGANETAPTAEERDVQCLEKALTQAEINDCFRRSSTVEARNLATLLRELAEALDAPRAHALMRNQDDWKRQVVAQCQWESECFEGGSVAAGVLSRCVAEHTAARVRRLKIFLCEGAGLTGPCEASEKY